MKFVDAVRKGRVLGPLRRTFEPQGWCDSYATLGGDAHDQALYKTGLLVHERTSRLRLQIRFAYAEHSSTTKLRALAAMANLFALELDGLTKTTVGGRPEDDTPIHLLELLTSKLTLPSGASFTPDELTQAIVDGCEVPIRSVLVASETLDGKPKFGNVNWDDVWSDVNLGILYRHLEDLWEDCLWNGYSAHDDSEQLLFRTTQVDWASRQVMSELRHKNNAMSFFLGGQIYLEKNGVLAVENMATTPRSVKDVVRISRKQVITFHTARKPTEPQIDSVITRRYIEHLSHGDLLHEPHARLRGATLDQLLGAWMIVCQVGQILRTRRQAQRGSAAVARDCHPEDAPLIQNEALVMAFVKALRVNVPSASSILEFLTFRGRSAQEIWAQPLIPASESACAPILAALSAEPTRVVDVWLAQLDVNMARRGPLFELRVRSELSQAIASSPIASDSGVLSKGVIFRCSDGRKEELDVVFRVGNVVAVAEVKCSIRPTEAAQMARHRAMVEGASAQITRKHEAILRDRSRFRNQLIEQGLAIPHSFVVLPIVILNSAIHAGMPVGGVPIVDLQILRVFFDGHITASLFEKSMLPKEIAFQIYSNIEQAAERLPGYLAHPPQLKVYVEGIKERAVSISNFDEEKKEWIVFGFDCHPNLPSLQKSALAQTTVSPA